jgi:hypothetical protein
MVDGIWVHGIVQAAMRLIIRMYRRPFNGNADPGLTCAMLDVPCRMECVAERC